MPYQSIYRSDLLSGQVAIVTGGGSGIGRCIAHELAALGAEVVLAGRTAEKVEAVAEEVRADGGRAYGVACDIRDTDRVEALFSTVLERSGRLDILVNNGGGQFAAPAATIGPRGWKAVVDTNLNGTFYMCRQAFLSWMSEHGGSIVNVVADMFRGMPMMAHSGAARAGVVNLTQTLALEWAQMGVRINAVAPGVIASSGLGSYPDAVREMMKTLPSELPMARFGTESEVSSAVCFLASPGARYVNGVTLRVDGGSSLYRHMYDLAPSEPTPRFSGFHRPVELPDELAGLAGKDDDPS